MGTFVCQGMGHGHRGRRRRAWTGMDVCGGGCVRVRMCACGRARACNVDLCVRACVCVYRIRMRIVFLCAWGCVFVCL